MNCIYRSIWNDTSGTFVAVSENANSAGKENSSCANATGTNARFTLKVLAMSMMMALGAQVHVYAQPVGGVVTAGSASIRNGAGSTTITQSSQNVAINWQSFNIAPAEAVRFVQPNNSSVALNRVVGADPSSILGSLSANGKVFLVNPNGILFGKGASVNVGGLVASTLNISDSDFMAGNYKFTGAGGGTILNQGTINADGGYVALLGANVSNEGTISAKLGTVALAAGNAVTLDVAGDGLLNVTVNEGTINALVQNGGLIRADGGQVLLTAQAAGNLLQGVVNNSGVIEAQTIEKRNGTIRLMGDMQSGTVNVGGTLDASAPNGGDGGFIETSAAHVKVADKAIITTQSTQGKSGTWLIDPQDFTVGSVAGDDIAGVTLQGYLVANNVVISTVVPGVNAPPTTFYGATNGAGDIVINDALSWTASGAATTLTLNAFHDVKLNANITATTGSLVATAGNDVIVNAMAGTGITTTGGSMTWTAGHDIQVNAGVVGGITATGGNIAWIAGRDININSAVTTTTGNFTACCGRDIVVTAKMTTTDGNVVLKAGSDGSGLGVPGVGGTVVLPTGPIAYTVTGPTSVVSLYYTPTSYATAHDYSGNFILSGGATGPTSGAPTTGTYMLVFAKGNDKVYDGNTTATLSFKGDPTAGGINNVTLGVGTATFDNKNVAPNIGITYSGYSLGGADAGKFALWTACLPGPTRTSAAITPAPLTLKANNASKVYGQTFTPLSTAFTTPVPPVAGETVTGVTETTTGSAPTASVAGSPYPIKITPGSATGSASFIPSNYNISYVDGVLTVNKASLSVKASDVIKTFGQTPALTAFTTAGLVNGDTITSVTETSPGAAADASVVGSPYAIAPSNAIGTYVPTNYTITYIPGALTVLALVPPVPVVPPVTPPVEPPPVVIPPIETAPIVIAPVPPEALDVERDVAAPLRGGGVPTWVPVIVLARTPAELQTIAPVIVPVVQPVEPVPVAVPAKMAPKIYVAPPLPRKQDRN